jgi:hypothetical protein
VVEVVASPAATVAFAVVIVVMVMVVVLAVVVVMLVVVEVEVVVVGLAVVVVVVVQLEPPTYSIIQWLPPLGASLCRTKSPLLVPSTWR